MKIYYLFYLGNFARVKKLFRQMIFAATSVEKNYQSNFSSDADLKGVKLLVLNSFNEEKF